MRHALERIYAATPDPKWVVAAAVFGLRRLCRQPRLRRPGHTSVLPAHLYIPGGPPTSPRVSAG